MIREVKVRVMRNFRSSRVILFECGFVEGRDCYAFREAQV